jgi:hypothetical protein
VGVQANLTLTEDAWSGVVEQIKEDENGHHA